MIAACTIVSPNYLPFARTLANSYRKNHPSHEIYVLIVADLDTKDMFVNEPFIPIILKEIGISDLESLAFKYDLLELNTNVKPTFLKFLLKERAINAIVYLDPDINVYSALTPILDLIEHSDVVLTPHTLVPIVDDKKPSERDLLVNGTYNLGFIAVRSSSEGSRFLDWWEKCCLENAFNEIESGLFVDQKWINLAPCYFENISICRHPGCNVAYWNLHERTITNTDNLEVNFRKLIFFHFSGIDVTSNKIISRHSNRFDLDGRPDLINLFTQYKGLLEQNHRSTTDELPYGFDKFDNGAYINLIARRLYAANIEAFSSTNPFKSSGVFYKYLESYGLISHTRKSLNTPTWRGYESFSKRISFIHKILRLLARVMPLGLYIGACRYMSYISTLRNQARVFPISRENDRS